HPKRLEDSGAMAEVEIVVLGEKAFEDELMRRRSAKTDVRVLVANDLVIGTIVNGGEPRVAERRQRIGGDRRGIALADDDDGCHAELSVSRRRNRRARKSKLYARCGAQ